MLKLKKKDYAKNPSQNNFNHKILIKIMFFLIILFSVNNLLVVNSLDSVNSLDEKVDIEIKYLEYTADVKIIITDNGLVEISGLSNHPNLKEGIYDLYTFKKQGVWTFNISLEDTFKEYNYTLILPKNSKVNYVGVYSVDSFEANGNLILKGNVKNKKFVLITQYAIQRFKFNYLPYILIISIITVLTLFLYIFLKYYKKHLSKKTKYSEQKFSERELEIINLLLKNKGFLTQANLEKITKFPKSSLSRNIASLERKKIIIKNKSGMSNKIVLLK